MPPCHDPRRPLPAAASRPKLSDMQPRLSPSPHLRTIDPPAITGASVLCLHGMFAGRWVFERLLPLLAAAGHPAAALSFRGHPPAPPEPAMGRISLRAYCDDAADAARALDRPIVVGHSMGGLVAMMLASRNLVRAVVLVSAAPPRGITVLSGALLARMPRYLPALLFSRPFLPGPRDLDALVLNRVPQSERLVLRERFIPDSGRAAREIALGSIRVPVATVRVPMLVVSGDDDRFIPLGVARKLARRYDAPLHVAQGHGHMLFAEPGSEVHTSAMLRWIAQLPPSVRERDAPVPD